MVILPRKRTTHLPVPANWQMWGRMHTVTDLWRPVVETICQTTEVASAQNVAAGFPGTCAVFVVDETVVVKLFPPSLMTDFNREKEVYEKALAGFQKIVPRLLAAGTYRDRIDWPFLVLEYMDGIPIREVRNKIRPENKLEIAKTLGEFIRRFHDTVVGPGVFDPNPIIWQNFVEEQTKACVVKLRELNLFSNTLLEQLTGFLHSDVLTKDNLVQPQLLNGDLTEDHLLLREKEGVWKIAGIIDWADARMAPQEYEWVVLWFDLCAEQSSVFQAVMDGYGHSLATDPQFCQRMLAYTCIHQYGPAIIEHVLGRRVSMAIPSLSGLLERLWPAKLLDCSYNL